MVIAKVLRRHAGGYLVYADELKDYFLCSLRGRLKKEGINIYTGDLVEIDPEDISQKENKRVNLNSAVITARIERKNFLEHPAIANVDQVIVVQAIRQPEWNPLLLDRYLVHLSLMLPDAQYCICLNKCDLGDKDELAILQNTYIQLGYQFCLVSAKKQIGIDQLKECLVDKTTVMTGPSGVGKSSIINSLIPSLNLKIDMDEDLFIGRHTTTTSELFQVPNNENTKTSSLIADTPGSSLGELIYPKPQDVAHQFPEIAQFIENCKFSDCLHLVETDCHVLANLEKISPLRYQSYSTIVSESIANWREQKDISKKIESSTVKYVGGKETKAKAIPKLNERYRTASRRTEKQKLSQLKNIKSQDEDAE
jgi:ribosome biogenesis GTPase